MNSLINLNLRRVWHIQLSAVTIKVTDYLAQESQLSDRDPDTVISTSESMEALSQHTARNINAGKQAKHKLTVRLNTMKAYWFLNFMNSVASHYVD
jgi:hypothetical protein